MATTPLRALGFLPRIVKGAQYTTLIKRPLAYKSSISLETLYPNSSLKLSTPSFPVDPNEKFSGVIPMDKLDITYSASSGPGGQNVNKVHTKVDLRFQVSTAEWLHPDVRAAVLEQHGRQLTKEGYLVLRSDATRSQQLNLADCLRKLRALLRAAAAPPAAPAPESVERARQRELRAARLRLADKRAAAARRDLRRPPAHLDL